MKNNEELKRMSTALRMLSVDMVAKAGSGHPGMPLGFADVATILFSEVLKYDSKNPGWYDRDRFILSAGHGATLLDSILALTGYEDVKIDDLKTYRQFLSKVAAHPEYGHLQGIETTTGPLGQGISNAVGMAIAEKMSEARFTKDLVNHKIYCVVGDGCLMEGISYEVMSLAGCLNLNNLVILFDDNNITIDGPTEITRKEDMKLRAESVGFEYYSCDGHNFDEIKKVFEESKKSNKPVFIAFKTRIGFGSRWENTPKCHGTPIKGDDLEFLRKNLNWDMYKPFEVPEDVLKNWNEVGQRGSNEFKNWTLKLEKSDKKNELLTLLEGRISDDYKLKLKDLVKKSCIDKIAEPIRKSGNKVLEIITECIPQIIGGTADLSGSVQCQTSSTKKPITKDDFSGRYIEYGIREFGMTGIMNGIYLHSKYKVYMGSYLVFSDYQKHAIRLSAMMKLPIIYIFSHDSIGVGEDGPTHQPIEQIAGLRAIPNLNVFRPCDLKEVAECYEIALKNKETPSAIIVARQAVQFYNKESEVNQCAKGAYMFDDCEGKPDIIIYSTGSEIEIAMKTKILLQKENKKVRVISVPCWELYEKQSNEYKKQILDLDNDNVLRVGIEAGCSYGWEKFTGLKGIFFGIPENTFGLSGPNKNIYDYFGLTPEKIVEKIMKKNT